METESRTRGAKIAELQAQAKKKEEEQAGESRTVDTRVLEKPEPFAEVGGKQKWPDWASVWRA